MLIDLYLQLLDQCDQCEVFVDKWTHQAKITTTIFADECLFVEIFKTKGAFHFKITVGGVMGLLAALFSESESALQFCQLTLQDCYALLELCIFGGQRFGNF